MDPKDLGANLRATSPRENPLQLLILEREREEEEGHSKVPGAARRSKKHRGIPLCRCPGMS